MYLFLCAPVVLCTALLWSQRRQSDVSDLSQFGLSTEEQDVFIWVLIGYICNTSVPLYKGQWEPRAESETQLCCGSHDVPLERGCSPFCTTPGVYEREGKEILQLHWSVWAWSILTWKPDHSMTAWEHLVSFSWWETDLRPVHTSVFPVCVSTWLYQTVWIKSLVHSSLNTFLCVTKCAVNWPALQHNQILQQLWESPGASCTNNPFTQSLQTVSQNAVYYKRRDVSVHAVL